MILNNTGSAIASSALSVAGFVNKRVLKLGSFKFEDFEIPPAVRTGIQHNLSVKRFVGGKRTIQTLGAQPLPVVFQGIATGTFALTRIQTLAAIARSGDIQKLTLDELSYDVIVEDFAFSYERPYHIPFSFVCQVFRDSSESTWDSIASLMSTIMSTVVAVQTTAVIIGDLTTTANVGTVNKTISAIGTNTKPTPAQIAAVLAAIHAAQIRLAVLMANSESELANPVGIAGLVIGSSPLQLNAYANSSMLQPYIVDMQNKLKLIAKNMAQFNTTTQTIQVGSGSVFDLASRFYGDPSQFQVILDANPQLNGDTTINGIQTINIPAKNATQ